MIQESLTMGLTLTALILLMIFLTIAEKIMIIVLLKTAGGKNTNKIMNDDLSEDAKSKEHSVIFAQNADNI